MLVRCALKKVPAAVETTQCTPSLTTDEEGPLVFSTLP